MTQSQEREFGRRGILVKSSSESGACESRLPVGSTFLRSVATKLTGMGIREEAGRGGEGGGEGAN